MQLLWWTEESVQQLMAITLYQDKIRFVKWQCRSTIYFIFKKGEGELDLHNKTTFPCVSELLGTNNSASGSPKKQSIGSFTMLSSNDPFCSSSATLTCDWCNSGLNGSHPSVTAGLQLQRLFLDSCFGRLSHNLHSTEFNSGSKLVVLQLLSCRMVQHILPW